MIQTSELQEINCLHNYVHDKFHFKRLSSPLCWIYQHRAAGYILLCVAGLAAEVPSTAGQRGDYPGQQFLLRVEVQSVLQIDAEVEEPEAPENLTRSFEIHDIFRGAVVIYGTEILTHT